jgi:hypothetical protein
VAEKRYKVEATDTFLKLSEESEEISTDLLSEIENFTVQMYDYSATCTSVNTARKDLFSKRAMQGMENLPPTQDALLLHKLHLKRAVYQGAHVYRDSASR